MRVARWPRSLRLNLILWLIGPIVLVLAGSLWLSWRTAWHQAMLIMERDLTASTRIIAEQVRYRDGRVGVIVPPAALELFATDAHDEVAYAVIDAKGILIAGFPGLRPAAIPAARPGPVAFDTMFRTEAMHAVTLNEPVITPDGTTNVTVTVAATSRARDALVRSLWLRGFFEQALLVLAAAASIWIGITIELRPLLRLRRSVLARGPRSLEPFDEADVQQELRPLVAALNAHMARLGAYLDRQQRFLDGAAHQMRTAIAILKTRVGLARRLGAEMDPTEVLAKVDEGLTTITRVTQQLLTLGRVEHERVGAIAEPVDLRECLRDVVSDLAPRALDAEVELSLEAETPCVVAASAPLVREMVLNLVDNAIHHAGAGAVATVSAVREGAMGVVTVADTGPGVPPDDRARLLRRFESSARAHGGAGLGLTIVAEIAEMFGGRVELPEPAGGHGFVARVALPAIDDLPESAAP